MGLLARPGVPRGLGFADLSLPRPGPGPATAPFGRLVALSLRLVTAGRAAARFGPRSLMDATRRTRSTRPKVRPSCAPMQRSWPASTAPAEPARVSAAERAARQRSGAKAGFPPVRVGRRYANNTSPPPRRGSPARRSRHSCGARRSDRACGTGPRNAGRPGGAGNRARPPGAGDAGRSGAGT